MGTGLATLPAWQLPVLLPQGRGSQPCLLKEHPACSVEIVLQTALTRCFTKRPWQPYCVLRLTEGQGQTPCPQSWNVRCPRPGQQGFPWAQGLGLGRQCRGGGLRGQAWAHPEALRGELGASWASQHQ